MANERILERLANDRFSVVDTMATPVTAVGHSIAIHVGVILNAARGSVAGNPAYGMYRMHPDARPDPAALAVEVGEQVSRHEPRLRNVRVESAETAGPGVREGFELCGEIADPDGGDLTVRFSLTRDHSGQWRASFMRSRPRDGGSGLVSGMTGVR